MDPNEVFEYVTEGMKWLAIGGGSYLAAMIGTEVFSTTLFHKKIESQEQLDLIVDEEARKLGLDPLKIDTKYNGETDGSRKNGERYDLHLKGDSFSTRSTVRHELYHILRDCDRGDPKLLNYLFVAEPRAKLYELTGIKL